MYVILGLCVLNKFLVFIKVIFFVMEVDVYYKVGKILIIILFWNYKKDIKNVYKFFCDFYL